MSPDLDAKAFAALAAELHDAPNILETAEQVVEHAVSELEASYGGITLITSGPQLETLAPSSPVVEDVDRLQCELSEGICFEAAWSGQLLAAEGLESDPRWPNWAPKTAALGIASFLAAELSSLDGHRIGTLNLYWAEPRSFTSEDLAFVEIFARHVAIALSAVMTREQLHTALDTRKRIGQAQGILMERYDLDEHKAFHVLRRYSQDHNIKLRVLADRLVETRVLPAEGKPGRD